MQLAVAFFEQLQEARSRFVEGYLDLEGKAMIGISNRQIRSVCMAHIRTRQKESHLFETPEVVFQAVCQWRFVLIVQAVEIGFRVGGQFFEYPHIAISSCLMRATVVSFVPQLHEGVAAEHPNGLFRAVPADLQEILRY